MERRRTRGSESPALPGFRAGARGEAPRPRARGELGATHSVAIHGGAQRWTQGPWSKAKPGSAGLALGGPGVFA